MAYKTNDKQEIIARVQKNSRGEYIQVSKIIPENGKASSVDVRLMYTADDDEIKPTTKGVRLNSEIAGEVIVAMMKALDTEALIDIQDEMETIFENFFEEETVWGEDAEDDEDDDEDDEDDDEDDEV